MAMTISTDVFFDAGDVWLRIQENSCAVLKLGPEPGACSIYIDNVEQADALLAKIQEARAELQKFDDYRAWKAAQEAKAAGGES